SWCMLKFNELKGWVRQVGIVFALLAPLMIGLLASRAGILAFGVLAVYFFIRAVWKRGAFSTRMWFLSVVMFGASLAFPATVHRVESAMDRGEDVGATEKKSSSQVRLVTWKNALTLMRNYPQGVGTGDVTNELVRLYDEQGELTASEKKLNAHNQYLQTGVELGWLGLLVLLSTMVPLALYAMRKRWELALIFLFLIAFNMLFESFLELQMGIMFYCFFLSFFTWQSLQKDELV
ncbi:MAG: O-antigen ligase family protein, partial [Flavobacteriales bacterium]|nr:O-antigen ligase family protein [Flavobacteriales bacterium]